MLKIYCASKLRHAKKWEELRTEWPEFEFVQRWSAMPTFQDGEPSVCRAGWLVDEEDVRKSDIVMVYAAQLTEDDSPYNGIDATYEDLRGALVEAGIGIGLDKCILLVGESPSFGTWQHHPLCQKVSNLEEAHKVLLSEHLIREKAFAL